MTFKAVGSPAVGKFIVASYDKFGNMVEFHDVAFPAYTGENQTITFNKTNLTNQGVVRKAFYVDSMLTLNSTFVAVEF